MDDDALFSDPRWDAFGLFREAYLAVSSRIDAEVSAAGDLDPSLTDLVFRLARTPGRALRAVEITRSLSTTTTRTTRLIDEAEQRGLVVRAPHPSDRRAVLVTLTDDGLAAARHLGHVALEAAQRHVHDRLSPKETAAFERLLRRLREPRNDESEATA